MRFSISRYKREEINDRGWGVGFKKSHEVEGRESNHEAIAGWRFQDPQGWRIEFYVLTLDSDNSSSTAT
jgi:hypothetical protein